jgi:hypothetical protein
LPGGFMDAVLGVGGATVAENAVAAALREVTEETGISKLLLEEAHIIPVGHRPYNRPFDIRMAWGDIPGTDIKKGEFFAVSHENKRKIYRGFSARPTTTPRRFSLPQF